MTEEREEFLTARQLAAYLQVSESTVRRLAAKRRIPSVRLTPRIIRFHLDAVREALEVLMGRDARVDLVLTDCTMPGINGWELVRIIGAVLPGLPTILMTGWILAPGEGLPARPTAVLEKPFSPAALTKSVRTVLMARGRL